MNTHKPFFSIVTPTYKCAQSILQLYQRISKTFEQMQSDFELIIVNDGSPESDWEIVQKLASQDKRIKGINLSRNFGQHYAITAGLDYAFGEWVVVMDCDLQDQPEEIPNLYRKALEGFDVVFGKRTNRQDSILKKTFSKLFYIFFNYLTETKFDGTIANFSISRQKVIENFRKMRERSRSFPLFISWVGFSTACVDVVHAPRATGKSAYSFRKMLDFALELVVSQTNKPLRIFIQFGFSISVLALLCAAYLIVRYIIYQIPVQGWTSLMVSIWFIGGLILANLGLIGIYIGKTYDETKNRPLYIIQDKIGFEDR